MSGGGGFGAFGGGTFSSKSGFGTAGPSQPSGDGSKEVSSSGDPVSTKLLTVQRRDVGIGKSDDRRQEEGATGFNTVPELKHDAKPDADNRHCQVSDVVDPLGSHAREGHGKSGKFASSSDGSHEPVRCP